MKTRGVPAHTLIAVAVACCFSFPFAYANPTGAQVVNGAAGFARPNASTLNVTNSPGAIVHWQGFSIGASEVTRFIQQSAASAVLNRVVGGNISQIQGQLLSNGKVFLINPSGIVVGPGAVIDTAGFVGSTLNMLDADFLAGKLKFQGDANSGSIINQGWIKTASGGQVLLVAPQIENSGLIHTPGGEIILAAGKSLTIASLDHEGVQFEIQAPTDSVLNVGKLLAEGGAIGVFAGILKHSGDIRATSLSTNATGQIVLKGQGDVELTAGSVVAASGPQGGKISVESKSGMLRASGTIEATGSEAQGGEIKINAGWAGLGGSIAADGAMRGGAISVNAGGLSLADRVSATSLSGKGGEISLNVARKSWETVTSTVDASGASGGTISHIAGQQITTSGNYLATGGNGNGGRIDMTAPAVKLLSTQVDASGWTVGGSVRIGGEYQGGKNLAVDELPNAQLLAVNDGVRIRADGRGAGAPGGSIVLWADQKAAVYGDISAQPGASGAGGSIEISSGDALTFGGMASAGAGGTVLFDPKNLTIGPASGAASQFALVLGYNYNNISGIDGGNLDGSDFFGSAVALNATGDQLAVGAPSDHGATNLFDPFGAVHLFTFSDGSFSGGVLASTLGKGYIGGKNVDVASLSSTDVFGSAVALNATGDRLAVGAPGDDGAGNLVGGSGGVYLFTFTDGSFSGGALAATLGAGYTGGKNVSVASLEGNDQFGTAVALNATGNRLAVGATGDDGAGNLVGGSGGVYLFTFTDGSFSGGALAATLGAGYTGGNNVDIPSLAQNDVFGSAVALNATGNRLAVGASGDDGLGVNNFFNVFGAVHLFTFTDGSFSGGALAGTIGLGYTGGNNVGVASLEATDQFGDAVALNAAGDRLAVGAPFDAGAGNVASGSGAVSLFTFTDGSFSGGALASTLGKGYTGGLNVDVASLEANDFFGSAVALNATGNRLAVGARGDDGAGAGNPSFNFGAVHLFTFTDSSFSGGTLAGTIGLGYNGGKNVNFSSLEALDGFGAAVALNSAGDRLAVGATGDDGLGFAASSSGAVHLFTFSDSSFSGGALAGTLGRRYAGGKNVNVTSLAADDQFGSAVALNAAGDRLAVGAIVDDGAGNLVSNSGAVYLFTFSDGSFSGGTLAATLGAGYTGGNDVNVSSLGTTEFFGSGVALNATGDRLAVGARNDANGAGAVRLFTFTDTSFSGGTLVGTIGKGYTGGNNVDVISLETNDRFGSAVALNAAGDRLAVGTPEDDGAGTLVTDAGAVHLFTFTDGSFSGGALAGTIGRDYTGGKNVNVASLEVNDQFGRAVALNAAGDRLAVGAIGDDGASNVASFSGAVHLFTFTDSSFSGGALAGTLGLGYTGGQNLNVASLEASDQFGAAVALNATGDRLAVGAWLDAGAGNVASSSGAVYFFNLAGGGGDAVASATFANNPGADSTITPASITAITDTGSAVILQANNDITLAAGSPIVTAEGGSGGSITMQAGRSVVLNANIFTDNGNLTITANDPAALAANRDAGAGGITMAAGTTLNAGTGTVALTVGAGVSGAASGNLVVENITAANVNLQQTGRTSGSSVLRASGSSLITATNLLMEVDFGGLASGGSIGTSAAPMRVQASTLEAHTHEASPGIFIESPNAANLQIGGVPFFAGSVKGVQNVTSGDISLSVNGTLTLQAAGASPGGPVATASGNITLRADDMNVSNTVTAATGSVTLTPFSTTRDVLLISPTAPPPGVLSLDTAELQRVTAGTTFEIGRSTDTGTLTLSTGIGSADVNAATLKLAHQNIALNQAINFSAGDESLTLTPGNQTTLSNDITLGGTPSAIAILTLNGATTWSAGTTIAGAGSGSSRVAVPSGATLTVTAPGVVINPNLDNQGLLAVNRDATINGAITGNSGTLRVEAFTGSSTTLTVANGFSNAGIIELNVSGTGETPTLNVTAGTLTNTSTGTIRTGGAAAASTLNAQVTNQGVIDVNQNLTIGNASRIFDSSTGTLDVAAGKALSIQDGTTRLGTGTVLAGAGTVDLVGAGHILDLTGNLTLASAGPQLNLGGSVTVQSASPVTLTNQGTLELTGDATSTNVSLDNQGLLWVKSSSSLNGPVSANTGTIRVEAFTGSNTTLAVANGFTNAGIVELLGSGTGETPTLAVTSGTLTNASAGTIRTGGAVGGNLNAQVTNSGLLDVVLQNLSVGNAGLTFTQQAGSINVVAGRQLSINGGTFDWQAGSLAGTGTYSFPGAAFTMTGSGARILNGPTVSAGSVTLAGGSLDLQAGTLNASGATTVGAGATLQLSGGSFATAGAVNVNGLLDLDVGTLNLGSGGTHAGTFDVASGATLNFSGGTHNLGDGVMLAGGGTFGITGGTFNVTGTTTGTTLASGTTLQTNANTVGGGGVLTNLGIIDASGSTMNVNLINQGTFDVATGSTNVTGGVIQQSGTIDVAAGQTLTVGGTGLDWQGGALLGTSAASYSLAALTFSGSGSRVLDGPTFNFSNLTVPGGSITLQSGALNLSGTTTIPGGATLAAAGGTMTATGPVAVGGTLQASAAGPINAAGQTITVPTAGVLDVNGGTVTAGLVDVTGGLVTGAGTVAANVVDNSAGTVTPGASPGILTIAGNYTQGPSGVLNAEIAGTTPGSLYDQLIVTGNVSLDGTLNTVFLGGFVPSTADTFNLIQAGGTVSGTFTTINLPAGASLSASYLPSTFGLITVGATASPVVSSPLASLSVEVIVTEKLTLDTVATDLGPAAPAEDTPAKPAPMCR